MEHNFKDILHNVNLTEGQISVILCALETSTKYADSDYIEEVDAIFQEWLNKCPLVVTDYQDYTNEFVITFNLEAD